MFSSNILAIHSAPADWRRLLDKSYEKRDAVTDAIDVKEQLWPVKHLCPLVEDQAHSGYNTYQTMNGAISPQHLHKVFGSLCEEVVVCQFQFVDVHVSLSTNNFISINLHNTNCINNNQPLTSDLPPER